MTPCPKCGVQLPDNVHECKLCGDEHALLHNGSGAVIARYSVFAKRVVPTGGQGPSSAEEEALELPSEIVAEPVIAYRVWEIDNDVTIRLKPDDFREMARAWDEGRNPFKEMSAPWLGGVGVDSLWARPVMEAKCNPPDKTIKHQDEAPQATCRCGIWALKDEAVVGNVIKHYPRTACAWGSVQLWGQGIVETEYGYRAKYAQPLSIKVFGISSEEAKELADVYECEVELVDELPIATTDGDDMFTALQGFSASVTALGKNVQAAMVPAAKAAQTMQATQLKTAQAQAKAILAAMGVAEPDPVFSPRRTLLDFMRWLFLGLVFVNLLFFIADQNWISLGGAIGAAAYCVMEFRFLQRVAKVIVGGIPLVILMFTFITFMALAILSDSLFFRNRRDWLGEGPTERWAWKQDEKYVQRLDAWITS